MRYFLKTLNWLSSLKIAIILLLLIAIGSSIGTALPQGETDTFYLNKYQVSKFLGLINGAGILRLQLDHVYSSLWFLGLLGWLSISLIVCSWKRQWPALKKAISWIDYKDPKQIQKLAISQTLKFDESFNGLEKLENFLIQKGWNVKTIQSRLAARKGAVGRVGPPLVHLGLILLIFGATFGLLKGQKVERFLAPQRSLDLLNPNGANQINVKLNNFHIDRGPSGQPEQFRSTIELEDKMLKEKIVKEISVNHPLRFNGVTIYQADWSLAAITIQINESPKLQLPLKKLDELGEEVWGVVIPSITDEIKPTLLTISSEQGPVRVFNKDGNQIGITRPNGDSVLIGKYRLNIINIIPSSGIILKYDPGVPIVYIGFAITLIGSLLSIISTKQLWLISEGTSEMIYIGGLSNRDSSGFAKEFPSIVKSIF